jgi:hypothetical protein
MALFRHNEQEPQVALHQSADNRALFSSEPRRATQPLFKTTKNMTETWDVGCTGSHRAWNFPCKASRSYWLLAPTEAHSEKELKGQLHRSRAADLIQRIEAAVLAAASERCSQHLRRLAE